MTPGFTLKPLDFLPNAKRLRSNNAGPKQLYSTFFATGD